MRSLHHRRPLAIVAPALGAPSASGARSTSASARGPVARFPGPADRLAEIGGREATVGPGATIYLPRNASVRLKNTGTEPLSIVAIFSQPGYEEYMRDISVPEGEVATPLTVEELTAIRARHRAHVVYEPAAKP
jgi:hypothetical protein